MSKVARIVDFGAFVNILPGKDGLVHISQISEERVERVSDKLAEGDIVTDKDFPFVQLLKKDVDKTEASPFFGSSQTEAELTPQDKIIGTLVEKAARQFISRLVPTKIDVEAEEASGGRVSRWLRSRRGGAAGYRSGPVCDGADRRGTVCTRLDAARRAIEPLGY